MRKFLAVTLSLLLVLSGVSAAAEGYNIVVNLKTLSAEYWQTVKGGIDQAGEELGIAIDVQGPAAETEIAEQVAQLETQLAAGPDAIVIAPLDADAVIGAIESSGYQGVVVFCDTDCPYENKVAFVGTSNELAAYSGGQYGVAINGEATKALIIYGQEGDNTSNLRRAGYQRALAEAGLTAVAELSGNNTTDASTKVMEDQLVANPGINLVLCHNDDSAIGAMNAIEAAGVSGVSIIGFNGDMAALELISAGGHPLIATIAQQPALMGYQSIMAAAKAIDGETIEKEQPVATVMIDAGNVAEYLK